MKKYLDIFIDDPIDEKKFKELQGLLATYSSDNGIDFISGMSGGRDSIYQVFLLSQILEKSVLCFSWANDFVSLDARNALFSTVSKLRKIQLLTFSLSQDVYGTYFSSMHKVFKRFCFCAHTMLLKAIPYAIENAIPFICVGYSPDQINGKSGYFYGTKEDRIKRIREYITAYRAMVLYAVNLSFPSMLNEVDKQLFGSVLKYIEKLEDYDYVPGMLMLAEYMPWKYSTVQRVVYDLYDLKKEGRNSLHSNCIYEPIRGYVEYIMKRPFLEKEADYIIRNGGLTAHEGSEALRQLNVTNNEPSSLNDFLTLTNMSKDEFYKTLETKMPEQSIHLLSDFLNSMIKLQGYEIKKSISVIE